MALIGEKDAAIVRERLSKLAHAVRLVVFTRESECELCGETRGLAEEVGALSDGRVRVEACDLVTDRDRADALGIDKVPAIVMLGEDGSDHGIRFFGIPAGYEFASLLEAIELIAAGDSGLAPETRRKLGGLSAPMHLQVFVTPTCPYCPRAVLTAFRFAMESKFLTASMVEATEFPDLAGRFDVSGVPHTVVGESPHPLVGAYPEAAAVDIVVAAAQQAKEG